VPDLQPIEYDPFVPTGVQFVPVDHDPWAAGDAAVAAINAGTTPDWREQEARANLAALGQPSPTAAQAAGGVLSTLGKIGHGVVNAARNALSPDLAGPAALGDQARDAVASVAAIPEQAIRGSEEDLKTMGSGQPMQSVAPAADAAMWMMGGASPFAEEGALGAAGGKLRKMPATIEPNLQNKMVNSYNSRIPSVEEQYYNWAGKDHSYDELDRKSAETMFGDEEDWPAELRDAIQKHGSAVQVSGPHGAEVFPPSNAPTRSQHMEDVVRNAEGSLMPARSLDDIMSGLQTKTEGSEGAAAEAFQTLAKNYGWDVSSGHRYFDLNRGDDSLHARISDHPNLTKTNPNSRMPDINIAPGAHDFHDAAEILQRAPPGAPASLADSAIQKLSNYNPSLEAGGQHVSLILPGGKQVGDFVPSHNELLKRAGVTEFGTVEDLGRETGAVRAHGPNNFEVFGKTPDRQQLRQMIKSTKDGGESSIYLDVWGPDEQLHSKEFELRRAADEIPSFVSGISPPRLVPVDHDPFAGEQ
jgi:hypothetical protein